MGQPARRGPSPAYQPLSPAMRRPRLAFPRLVAGELRVLVQGTSRWWWLVVGGVYAASLAVPAGLADRPGSVTAVLLSIAWIWPVLVWSRLGTQRRENGLDTLLGSYPAPYRRLAAEWASGVVFTALTGLGPLLRMAVAGDGPALAAWTAGALFIPSLALMLGTVSGTHRMFQVGYTVLWYMAVNQVAAADYLGIVTDDRQSGPTPLMVAAVAATLLMITFGVQVTRRAATAVAGDGSRLAPRGGVR